MKRYIPSALLAITLALTGCKSFNPTPEQITAVGNLALTAAQIAASFRDDNVYRVAICVGVYQGSVYGTCDGADTDAMLDAEFFRAAGYDNVTLILNEEATRQNIVDSAYAACANLKKGDLLYIKGSSHGGQKPNPLEPDGKDEYFCAADGPLIDNDIWRLLCQLPPGVRVVMAFDTCNSGTMYRSPHDYGGAVAARIDAIPPLSCIRASVPSFYGSLLYIGGCGDSMVSYGNKLQGGQLSVAMRATIPKASTYSHWCDIIKATMPPNQIPAITEIGPSFSYMPILH